MSRMSDGEGGELLMKFIDVLADVKSNVPIDACSVAKEIFHTYAPSLAHDPEKYFTSRTDVSLKILEISLHEYEEEEDTSEEPNRVEVEELLRTAGWTQNKDYPYTWYHPDNRSWIQFAQNCKLDEPSRAPAGMSYDYKGIVKELSNTQPTRKVVSKALLAAGWTYDHLHTWVHPTNTNRVVRFAEDNTDNQPARDASSLNCDFRYIIATAKDPTE